MMPLRASCWRRARFQSEVVARPKDGGKVSEHRPAKGFPRHATASACGCASFTVQIFPFSTTRLAAGCAPRCSPSPGSHRGADRHRQLEVTAERYPAHRAHRRSPSLVLLFQSHLDGLNLGITESKAGRSVSTHGWGEDCPASGLAAFHCGPSAPATANRTISANIGS